MNLEVTYLYRDAANYKQFKSVVVPAPDGVTTSKLEDSIRQHFIADQLWADVLHFRPEALGWPTAYFDDHDENNDDIGLHELDSITTTDEPATADLSGLSLG